jgi:hypothetical protein
MFHIQQSNYRLSKEDNGCDLLGFIEKVHETSLLSGFGITYPTNERFNLQPNQKRPPKASLLVTKPNVAELSFSEF